jgi:hypothetical protein
VPAFTAAMAVSTFIHASTVPAVNVEAERNLFDHVELVGHTGGQSKRHRLGARGSQRTSHDNRQAGRNQEFAHEISLWLGVSLLLILAQRDCICTTEAAARTAVQVGSIQRRVEAQHQEYSPLDLLDRTDKVIEWRLAEVREGSKTAISQSPGYIRFAPKCRLSSTVAESPLSADNRHSSDGLARSVHVAAFLENSYVQPAREVHSHCRLEPGHMASIL